jgi:hypothetical protein
LKNSDRNGLRRHSILRSPRSGRRRWRGSRSPTHSEGRALKLVTRWSAGYPRCRHGGCDRPFTRRDQAAVRPPLGNSARRFRKRPPSQAMRRGARGQVPGRRPSRRHAPGVRQSDEMIEARVWPGQRKTRIEVRLGGAAVFAGARVILLAGSPKIRETVKGFGRANQDSF